MALAELVIPFGDPRDDQLPLEELIRKGERRLIQENIVARAGSSALYVRPWRKAGVRAGPPRTLDELQRWPLISGADWLQAQSAFPLGRLFVETPRLWVSSAARGNTRKWVPYGERDLREIMGLANRMSRLVQLNPCDRVLIVTGPAPRAGNALPYLWAMADMLSGGRHLEFIPGSMATLKHSNWPIFASRMKPAVLWASMADALALRQPLLEAGWPVAGSASPTATPRKGLFFGHAMGEDRAALEHAYDLEAFSLYFSAEFPVLAVECPAHQGLHLWLDACLPEILPRTELERERSQAGYQPQAIWLTSAAEGEEGELVATTFGQSLPLVRYRTGDLVRMVSASPCSCGCTHPRIEALGRMEPGAG
ncbi:MAG: hypothetical protein WCO14_03685 [bacterium]